jgi:ribonuclease P protein component
VPGVSKQSAKKSAAFPRSMRLLRRSDFERVYKTGRRHFSASMTLFFLPRQEQATAKTLPAPGLRIGFTVGRALGNAVQRNRMKRRLREVVRLSRPPVAMPADVVINPKKSLLTADFQSVRDEVERAFEVIEQKLNTNKRSAVAEEIRSETRKPGA